MAKNRTELVAEVAEKSGKSQATVNAVLDAVFQVFESSVSKGEKITIPGWLALARLLCNLCNEFGTVLSH